MLDIFESIIISCIILYLIIFITLFNEVTMQHALQQAPAHYIIYVHKRTHFAKVQNTGFLRYPHKGEQHQSMLCKLCIIILKSPGWAERTFLYITIHFGRSHTYPCNLQICYYISFTARAIMRSFLCKICLHSYVWTY